MDRRETAIVGFIDILGYGKVVKTHIEDFELILNIEKLLKAGAGLLNKKIPIRADYQEYRDKIVDLYNARVICDSVIFTLPVSKIIPEQRFKDNNENISNYLFTFFQAISMFCPFFIAKTGHVLRGGISVGAHYENDEDKHLFIFSQAFVGAVELEKKARYARILIHPKLIEYLKNISFPYMEDFFYKDEYGDLCFNLYSILRFEDKDKKVLADIKESVSLNIRANIDNDEVMEKLKYFVKYHDKKILEREEGFKDLVIGNRIFEN